MKSGKKFLFSVLTCTNPAKALKSNLNDLISVIPEISSMIGFGQKHPHQNLDLFEHTLKALTFAKNDINLRLALLLHDIGKPQCFEEENGVRHYNGHAEKSAEIAKKILTRITYSQNQIEYICKLIVLHDTPLTKSDITQKPWFSKTLFEMQKCDALAHNPEHNEKRLKYIEETTELFNACDKAKKESAPGLLK